MEKKLLKTLGHRFEAEMLKDMLKEVDVEVYISDQNGPEQMTIYLGQSGHGVDVYVDGDAYERALEFLEAQADELVVDEDKSPKPMRFPYWIILGFAVALLLFAYFTYWR